MATKLCDFLQYLSSKTVMPNNYTKHDKVIGRFFEVERFALDAIKVSSFLIVCMLTIVFFTVAVLRPIVVIFDLPGFNVTVDNIIDAFSLFWSAAIYFCMPLATMSYALLVFLARRPVSEKQLDWMECVHRRLSLPKPYPSMTKLDLCSYVEKAITHDVEVEETAKREMAIAQSHRCLMAARGRK